MNKKIIVILVPIIILIVIIITLTILYFTTDLFKSNEELFWKYFAQNESIIDIASNGKQSEQNTFKQNNSFEANGNLFFTLEQGEGNLKQFNITINSRHDAINDRNYTNAILKNGELDLFQVSIARSGDIYAIRCDEVFPNYVGIQNAGLKQLAENYGITNAENFPDSIDIQKYFESLKLTEEQKQHLIDTYLPIIKNNIDKDEYIKDNEQITIDFSEYNSNVYTYDVTTYTISISGEKLKNILIDCANTLKADTETLILVSGKLSTFGVGTEYTDTANLSSRIEEWIASLSEITIEKGLDITLYEYDGSLIRTNINIGEQFEILYDKVESIETLTIDISNSNIQNEIENKIDYNILINDTSTEENSEDIIDLNEAAEIGGNEINTTRIQIIKSESNTMTTNEIKVIPNINNIEENICLTINMSKVQNDNINNSYTLIFNTVVDTKKEVVTIAYENNIYRVDQVEEIEELTSSNTAIANNYAPEMFSNFINEWLSIFENRLTEKMVSLGFDELA